MTNNYYMDEIEFLMLEYFNGDSNLYIRWMLRPNPELNNEKPFTLCDQGKCDEVVALVRAFTSHHRFLSNITTGK